MEDIKQRLDRFAADSPVRLLDDPFPGTVPIQLYLKRDDLLHPLVSGNKWRKLRYNIAAAAGVFTGQPKALGEVVLLTFGGAYSNHLYATAAAGQLLGFRTVGVVRGDEPGLGQNPTLTFCQEAGMELHFISREQYRQKYEPALHDDLRQRFGNFMLIPEGGSNNFGVMGTTEIMPELIGQLGHNPDYVCCPVGTGGTLAGLAETAPAGTTVLGFSVLKGVEPGEWVPGWGYRGLGTLLDKVGTHALTCRWPPVRPHQPPELITEYHFGGYAKTTPELLDFIRAFERKTGVLIEQVYTGKMLYGIYDLARRGFFPHGATVVAVHTGGLQGRSGALD